MPLQPTTHMPVSEGVSELSGLSVPRAVSWRAGQHAAVASPWRLHGVPMVPQRGVGLGQASTALCCIIDCDGAVPNHKPLNAIATSHRLFFRVFSASSLRSGP